MKAVKIKVISKAENKTLVLFNNIYYLISTAPELKQTLIFISNKNGQVWDWTDVGRGESDKKIIENFSIHLYEHLNSTDSTMKTLEQQVRESIKENGRHNTRTALDQAYQDLFEEFKQAGSIADSIDISNDMLDIKKMLSYLAI